MSGIARKLMGVSAGAEGVSVTLDGSTLDNLTDETFPFNYANSYPAGTFIVVVVTATENNIAIGAWDSVVDSEGNTFTLAVQGGQSNGFTFSAVWFCVLSNPVTSSTTITATSNVTVGANGRKGSVFVLEAVSDVENAVNSPQTRGPIVATSSTVSGSGIAFHVVSYGSGNPATVVSVSPDFDLQVESLNSGCSQYIATSVVAKAPSASVSNTLTLTTNAGRYANMMAIFE